MNWALKTDIGRVRKMNQDSLAALGSEALQDRAGGLFVLADGMGGRVGGEIASRLAVDAVKDTTPRHLLSNDRASTREGLGDAVHAALLAANTAVWQQGRNDRTLKGMGTTCVMALVRDDLAAIGNAGDSRVYMLRDSKLILLTHDHVLLHNASSGEQGPSATPHNRFHNTITRAIGFGAALEPDVTLLQLREGDVLLLCSDGLTNTMTEGEIARVLIENADPQNACDRLVDAANNNGGVDNISVIVMRYGDVRMSESPAAMKRQSTAPDFLRPAAEHLPVAKRSHYLWWIVGSLAATLLAGVAFMLYHHRF